MTQVQCRRRKYELGRGGHVRRLILIFATVFVAAGFVSLGTLSAKAEPADQYQSSDGSEASNAAPQGTAPEESQPEPVDVISQGSALDADSPAVMAARADVAEEERLPDYSQVVDNNTTRGRFSAPGWEEKSGNQGTGVGQVSHGGDYAYADSGAGPARFKVRIPTSNDYTVYAWWPASSGNSDATRFGIGTASGTQWTEVDQTTDGGIWIKLGTYAMEKGERFVQVSADSPGTGNVVADAVAVVRGDVTAPPDEQGATSRSGDSTYSASAVRNPTGHDVVRVAKSYLGTRYRWGACTRRRMSCTCETKRTYAHFGHTLPMTEGGQWKYDRSRRIAKANLRIGDEVFFKENGRRGGITHVAIYSGNGNIVHASSYFGKVVESKMKYIRGYYGAKRYRLH
jgi:cell wall-associated NlpC family hydrolase